MLWKTFLVGLVAFIGYCDHVTGKSMLQRPVVMGPLVGIALGDFQTGLAVGGTLELAFMGNMAIGAAIPPEITAGGVLGTAFAITSGSGAEVAVALALPIATLALLIKNLFYLIIRPQFMLHTADKFAAVPQFIMDGISIAAGILPALGFAMLANMLINDKVAPWFAVGFLLSAYLNIPVLGLALLGGVVTLLILRSNGTQAQPAVATDDEEDF